MFLLFVNDLISWLKKLKAWWFSLIHLAGAF